MANLQPMLPSAWYTQAERELAYAGRCIGQILLPTSAPMGTFCGKRSDPKSKFRFCADCDHAARTQYPDDYANPEQYATPHLEPRS
ncbi:MAG TPA: hypothetical protein VK453_25615 [Micromonosporaceae bacterium]|nr:hypothetical protein [Micromonosporaceae bacterium]